MFILELIKETFKNLFSLSINLIQLISLLLALIFFSAIAYYLIIRPLIKVFTDKGKRIYWFLVICLLIWAFVLGPIITLEINDIYEDNGFLIGISIYLVILVLLGKLGAKYETK